MFIDRVLVVDPIVLYRQEMPRSDFVFKTRVKVGEFYLVKPVKAKEIFYIQMLGKDIDRFLPAEGEGILITRSAIEFL